MPYGCDNDLILCPDPGVILGNRDLRHDGVAQELRTTGGDLLQLDSQRYIRPGLELQSCRQLSHLYSDDGWKFLQGRKRRNNPTALILLRYRFRNATHKTKQLLFGLLNYIRRRINR